MLPIITSQSIDCFGAVNSRFANRDSHREKNRGLSGDKIHGDMGNPGYSKKGLQETKQVLSQARPCVNSMIHIIVPGDCSYQYLQFSEGKTTTEMISDFIYNKTFCTEKYLVLDPSS